MIVEARAGAGWIGAGTGSVRRIGVATTGVTLIDAPPIAGRSRDGRLLNPLPECRRSGAFRRLMVEPSWPGRERAAVCTSGAGTSVRSASC